jgi:hypothetical protein
MGNEVLVAIELFVPHALIASTLRTPQTSSDSAASACLRACAFTVTLIRSFRAVYRRQFPDADDDPPALRIGIDSGPAEAVVPRGCLSVLVSGSAVRGAATLAAMAMPGSALLTGEVRAAVSGHFSTTELHRLRVAGRTTAVSMLGQQFGQVDDIAPAEPTFDSDSMASSEPSAVNSLQRELNAILADDPSNKGELTGNMLCSESFADPDVERDYLMHENNTSLTRYLGPVLMLLAVCTVCGAYYAEGASMNAAEWTCAAASAAVALAALYVVHRGRMSQRKQIAVRLSIMAVAYPLLMLSAYFHHPFFDYVRFRMAALLAPVGFGLDALVPSRLPAVVNAIVCLLVRRMCVFVFTGRTFRPQMLSMSITEFASILVTYQVIRSRNRWQYVDYAIARHAKDSWTRARLIIEEMLAQLLPAHLAQQIAQEDSMSSASSGDACPTLISGNAAVYSVSLRAQAEDSAPLGGESKVLSSPTTSNSDDSADGVRERECAHDRSRPHETLWAALRAMPSVESGAVHLQPHGPRFLLFCNLVNDAQKAADLGEFESELNDAQCGVAAAFGAHAVVFSNAQSNGPLCGGIAGTRAAKGFVAVGPTVDTVLSPHW